MDLRTGHPFWLAKNGFLNAYPGLNASEDCDVAIIGAGITGALIANELSEAGLDCVVLDQRDAGTGSTVASTALLQYEIDTELWELIDRIGEEKAVRAYRLGLEAIDRIEEIGRQLPRTCEFERRESFYFASRNAHKNQLLREYKCRKSHGFDVDYLDAKQVAERFPFAAPAGIISRGDAVIDVFQFTHELLKSSQKRGTRIYDRTKVGKFDRDGEGFLLTTDRGFTVTAGKLIMATGYESKEYLKSHRGSLHSTFATISEPMDPMPQWPNQCLIWESARPYFYLRTTPDHRILIGGEDTPHSSDHRSESLLARKTARLVSRFEALFPDSRFEVAYNWAGTFGESEDGLACIGEPPEWPGICFAVGFGGNGITMSVIAAKILVDHCLGRPNPDADIYRFDRKPV